jgi:hypothetical protein
MDQLLLLNDSPFGGDQALARRVNLRIPHDYRMQRQFLFFSR